MNEQAQAAAAQAAAAETLAPKPPPLAALALAERQLATLEQILGCLRRIASALEKSDDKSIFERVFGKH